MQFNVATGAITGRPPAVINAENPTATATDGYNAASTPATFSIPVINNAPTIGAFTCPDGVPNTPYACTIGGYDQDRHSLVYTATNLPGWASFNETNGLISGTPISAGTQTGIVVSASDPYQGQVSSAAFQISVVNTAQSEVWPSVWLRLPAVYLPVCWCLQVSHRQVFQYLLLAYPT